MLSKDPQAYLLPMGNIPAWCHVFLAFREPNPLRSNQDRNAIRE